MSGISSLGVGSGLDLGSLVDNLVQIERTTAEGPLNRSQARAELRLSALGSFRSSVASLNSSVSALAGLKVGFSLTSSWEAAVDGSATADAEPGSYVVVVQQLATAQSLATPAGDPFVDPDAELGEGTLTLAVGVSSVNIELTSGENSLRDVRDAINASDIGIHAVLVQDGSNYRLLLSSDQTGTDGAMTLTVSGTVDSRLASAAMEETAAAQDALFSVNGLSLSSSSNSIENVLPGVTLDLRAETGPDPVTINIASNTSGLADKINGMLTAYNALVANMAALGGASADGRQAGPLVGDQSLRALQRRIGAVFAQNVDAGIVGNPYSNLVGLGVHTDESGRASLNSSELFAAFEENPAGVEALVSAFATSFSESLEAFEGEDGILGHRATQLGAELQRIGREREEVDRRLEQIEIRLRKRFSALDSLVAQFQNTSTFLTQRLATLETLK